MSENPVRIVVMKNDLNEDVEKEFKGSTVIVYKYTDEGYEGWGHLFALTQDGKVVSKDLSHCSCCEAWEDSPEVYTMEEFLVQERTELDGDEHEARERFLKEIGKVA